LKIYSQLLVSFCDM